MASRGQSITIQYVAWDMAANGPKTGDVLNHTLRWVKDGVAAAPTNAPAEVDAINAPGVYSLVLTAVECTCNLGTLAGKSSTANVVLYPVSIAFEQLPTAAAGTNGGLPTVDASNKVTAKLAAADVTGNLPADVIAISGDTVASDNLEAALDGTGGVTIAGNLSGSVGSVTGAVGSVTGNVGGSVGSIATGGIAAASFAVDAITSSALAASAITEIQSGLATEATAGAAKTAAESANAKLPADTSTKLANLDATVSSRSTLTASAARTEMDNALVAIRLNELFSVPLSGQPVAGSLLGDLTEDDLGTQRFTANSLEQTPSGTGASAAEVWGYANRSLSDKTGFSLAADQSGVTIGTVNTITGHTPQTGDAYARLGAPVGVSISADIAAVKASADAAARTSTGGTIPITNGRVDANATATVDEAAIAAAVDSVLSAAHGAGSWATGTSTGDGDIPIDHNYGGVDNYRYTIDGAGADNVVIKAYPKADYDAGTRSDNPPTTYTGADGRWLAPLNLDAGQWYLVAWIPGVTQAKVTEITVA